ncbi:MAG: hypothetical protein WA192_06380, partial [Candidatus Acidiferrales bacterium]
MQFVQRHRLRIRRHGNFGLRDRAIRQRSGGTGNHALAARYAGGFAHRFVRVKSDPCGRSFAHASQNKILANLIAASDTAITQNARIEIHGNAHRGIVRTAARCARWVTRTRNVFLFRERFQFAIARLPFARARAGMIRHQQLKQRAASPFHAIRCGIHHHPRFHGPNARRRVNPGAHVHHAYAANANRLLVLLVAQRGNANVVHARSVKYGRPRRHGDF